MHAVRREGAQLSAEALGPEDHIEVHCLVDGTRQAMPQYRRSGIIGIISLFLIASSSMFLLTRAHSP